MPQYRKCAVLNCEDRTSIRHRFPNPKRFLYVYERWVEVIGNDAVRIRDPEYVYKTYYVCHAHFVLGDNSSNNRLRKDAVPSKNLPTHIPGSFSTNIKNAGVQLEGAHTLPSLLHSTVPTLSQNQHSTSSSIAVVAQIPVVRDVPTRMEVVNSPERSGVQLGGVHTLSTPVHSTVLSHAETSKSQPSTSTSATPQYHLHDVGETRTINLTPKARKFYMAARQLKLSADRYKARKNLFKQKLNSRTQEEAIDYITS